MSLTRIVRGVASDEIKDAARWYERRVAGDGRLFSAEVRRVMGDIMVQPLSYAVAHGDIRQVPVGRFPYCVYSRALASRIIVVGVVHNARDPSVWQGRR